MRTLFLLIVLLSAMGPVGKTEGADAGSRESRTPITRPVVLAAKGWQLFGSTQVGNLRQGGKYRIQLQVFNPTDITLGLDSVQKSCSCINFEKSSHELLPQQTLHVEFEVDVPEKSKQAEGVWRVDMRPKDVTSAGLRLTIEYALSGFIGFKADQVVVRTKPSEERSTFKVPLMVTDPIRLADVEIVKPESLGSIDTRIVGDAKSNAYLEIKAAHSNIAVGGATGELAVEDRRSGRSASILLIVDRGEGVSLYPAILRVRHSANGDHIASAMLRLNGRSSALDENNPDGSQSRSGGVRAQVYISGAPQQLELQKLSEEIYRARIIVAKGAAELLKTEEKPTSRWLVHDGGKAIELSVPVRLINAPEL